MDVSDGFPVVGPTQDGGGADLPCALGRASAHKTKAIFERARTHRRRRPRRPLPGLLLHIDGSKHRSFQDDRYYDLLVIRCVHRRSHSIAGCPMGDHRSDRQRWASPQHSDAELDQERYRFLDRSGGGSDGLVFRAVNRGGWVTATSITPRTMCQVVKRYGESIGAPKLAPHDLRRTFAKFAHKGRSRLEQIQLSLGHASITTTERYLGVRRDLTDAPCDHLGLTIEVPR